MKRIIPGLSRRQVNRTWMYEFPALKKCRKDYEAHTGIKFDWDGDNPGLPI